MKKIFKFPLFLFFFALYPGLSLLAWNIREVEWQIVIRPLLVTIIFMLLVLCIFQLFLRDWKKASILALVVLIMVFSYGHVLSFIQNSGLIGKPNRFLAGFYSLIFVVFVWWFLRKIKDWSAEISALNFVSVILVGFTASQIVFYETKDETLTIYEGSLTHAGIDQLPDIYYIILDGYDRADLLKEKGYDNSDFINFLRAKGFYVADCSRSNYRKTVLSVSSTLNMDYVYNIIPNDGFKDADLDPVINSIRENWVRGELKNLGYTDISFNMGYKWGTWWDADLFLPEYNRYTAYLENETLNSFEVMYIQTTILTPLIERNLINIDINSSFFSRYRDHYERVHYILDELPELVTYPGPKLVYAHLIVPHGPYVFLPDGSYDPTNREGFEDDHGEEATIGYINNVKFINNRMKVIIEDILKDSEEPPIILLQADHSYAPDYDDKRFDILNAYYLPDGSDDGLYPTITPVNSFRVIFNRYFGTDFPLIEDKSITSDVGHPYSTVEAEVTPCP
jgi:hypothetical protein